MLRTIENEYALMHTKTVSFFWPLHSAVLFTVLYWKMQFAWFYLTFSNIYIIFLGEKFIYLWMGEYLDLWNS